MSNEIRVLIVDDEPLACRKLRRLLEPDLELLLLTASGGQDALELITKMRPDVLLLDIQMPGMDGFDLLREIPVDIMPYVIFVTAFDNYAIEAFEVRALDYLLKPFSPERLENAMKRAKLEISQDRKINSQAAILDLVQNYPSNYLRRVVVKDGDVRFFIDCSRIDWIEAVGKYSKIHAGKDQHMLRLGLKNLELKLNPGNFVRIHKSTIINIDKVDQLQSWFHGDYRVILRDGTKLMLSRRYKERLEKSLGGIL